MPATFSSLQPYIEQIVAIAGSDLAVGKYLGFSDGSRIGQWRRGKDRPSELACIKLARWVGDSPLEILRLAGYTEMADLLDGSVVSESAHYDAVRNRLAAVKEAVEKAELHLHGQVARPTRRRKSVQ